MNRKFSISVCTAIVLLAACNRQDDNAPKASDAPAPASSGSVGDTATTPGGNAGDASTTPPGTPSTPPDSQPPPSKE